MEIKGELKRGGLPSLFRNFATENFHGVLTISSPVGEKLISLTENEVTIYCDELNEASRLGNILLGRGQVTEAALDETLRHQRKLEPRPKLGDMLVQRGIVSENAISDARRFQIEEDICDILSWKKARFNFAGAGSAREIHPEDFAPDQVHRLTIDPDTFFKYVAKVTEDWDTIGDRLPTQYLCFKVSAKVNESSSQLTNDAQRVLRFLKEGRTVEGAVKQSCLGRIQVCVQVIELLEKGLVLPASGADLRFMASEHRAQKRYHDALYIYRRLLESPDAKDERVYLENLIAEISEEIVRLKARGEYGEEAVVVSHKGAKEKYFKSQRRRHLILICSGVAAFLIVCVVLFQSVKPPPDLPQHYKDVITRVDTLFANGEFASADKDLDELYASFPDKESHVARSISEKRARIPGLIHNYVVAKGNEWIEQGKRGGDDRAKALAELHALFEKYPQDPAEVEFKETMNKWEADILAIPVPLKPDSPNNSLAGPVQTREELMTRMRKAEDLKQQKKYCEARREFAAIQLQAPANLDIWKQAGGNLKAIQDIEDGAADLVRKAREAKQAHDGEKAIALLIQAIGEFGDLEGLSGAETQKTMLDQRKSAAIQLFKSAKESEDSNSIFDSREKFEQLVVNYPEFPIAAEARKRAEALTIKCDALRKLLEAALDAVKKEKYRDAQKLYKTLLETNARLLSEEKVPIPVYVTSNPPGSKLTVNGESMFVTPRFVILKAGEPFEITVERTGFCPRRVAADRLTPHFFDISLRLDLDPVVFDFKPAAPRALAPLSAPPGWFDNHLLVLSGSELLAIEPPSSDIQWRVQNLYDPKTPLPDGAPIDDKNYWNFRVAPTEYKPGILLLPSRTRELLEIDLRQTGKPVKRNLFARLTQPPPEIAGQMYIEEHSKLAGKSLLAAAFTDGTLRCYIDFDKDERNFAERWSQPLDPQDNARHEAPAAGLFAHKGLIWVLSGAGMLQAVDPLNGNPMFKRLFDNMSPRSSFSSKAGDPLVALIQRNGRFTLFNLEQRQEVWSLPARAPMDEAVGASIEESAVFITARTGESGELSKYPRVADSVGGTPKPLGSVKLDGYVNLDMASGKHLYLITHFNKVCAYSKTDLSLLWDFTLKPEMGEPKSIRVFGDYVYVSTDKAKVIVLKAE